MGSEDNSVEIRPLDKGDESVLENVAPEVFDDEIDAEIAREFLSDERHHLVVALDDDVVVGFVSAVHYVHPDKAAPEFWINEVGVATTHHRRGIGRAMMNEAMEIGKELGCSEAWVLTERENVPAMSLYATTGGVEHSPDSVMFTFHLNGEPTE